MNHPLTDVTRALGGIAYGGDYNPEQWPRDVWRDDVRLMREAGVNLVTVGVFSWSRIQPRPDVYDFSLLDEVLDLLHTGGIAVDLATATAAPPPWFTRQHPDARPVTATGTRLAHGSRQVFCPSSPAYAQAADALTAELATRYREHPAVVMWHVHNEWGNHNALCFCEISAQAFRAWLSERYKTVEALNDAWGTDFWSQRYGDWDEIDPPRGTTAFRNPGQELDYRRFSSDALLTRHIAETAILRRTAPNVPVTTNVMGTLEKKIDGFAFAAHCDLVSVDHYLPAADPDGHIDLALNADLARGMAGGRPWLLMEHSTSAVNWQGVNVTKQPGETRRNSLTHLARGADGLMFFQWRQSRAGAEKWHSAMLPHAGADSRIHREVKALGAELGSLSEVTGSRVRGDVALLFDWHSWWALELQARPSDRMRYLDAVRDWYEALWTQNITCDIVQPGADLSGYRAVLAPGLYLLTDHDADNLTRYVERGGNLAVGCFSGVVDEHDRMHPGAHPGALRDVLGLVVDEYLPLRTEDTALLEDGMAVRQWAERVEPRGCGTVLRFKDTADGGPARGGPAVTRHTYGRGTAWYTAARLPVPALRTVVRAVCETAGAHPAVEAPPGLEAVRRAGDRHAYLFLINHTSETVRLRVDGTALAGTELVDGRAVVPAGGVVVIREDLAPASA
ncbi:MULTISPECIES: beta-galactosidase [unclassified Streptomyces]|uniref:beta-galactosidase n=1 Tax=unclassified Streptomyces TaxID=2593676 RepID=UPI0035D5FE08